jgi:hypothetical protein
MEPVVERETVDEEDVGPPLFDEGADDDEQCDADLEACKLPAWWPWRDGNSHLGTNSNGYRHRD